MKNSKQIISEIQKDFGLVVNSLLQKNLVRDYCSFSIKDNNSQFSVTRPNRKNESNILFDRTCSITDMTDILLENHEYNLLFYDKGIFQFEFEVYDGKIIKERFIFLKKQNKLWNKEEISLLDDDEIAEDWFSNEIGIPIIIRVDFDKHNYVELTHPISHMTINNYEECRIPMRGPISISKFVNFILNIFYNDSIDAFESLYDEEITISDKECELLHFDWGTKKE